MLGKHETGVIEGEVDTPVGKRGGGRVDQRGVPPPPGEAPDPGGLGEAQLIVMNELFSQGEEYVNE